MKDFSKNAFSGFARKIGIVSLMALCFALVTASVNAQTVLVNYDFASTTLGSPCGTGAPLTTATGVTSSFTVGGTGACTTPAGTATMAPPAFVANAVNQSVSVTGFAAGSTNYFQFQLNGVSSYQNYMLYFNAQRSGTGPVNVDIQYSTDGTNFTTFQTINPGNGVFLAFNIDLSAVAAIEGQPTVYFRLFASGGTGAAGTFRVDNFQTQAATTGTTAATVSVGGRVTDSKNRAISGATVIMTDGNGQNYSALTDETGNYRFEAEVGQVLLFEVRAKRYFFTQPLQVVSLNDEVLTVNFKGSSARVF